MCLNCCNHLPLILQHLAAKSMTAEVLGFADTAGETMIKQLVDREMVK
jgi:hypothetical protein